MATERFIRWFQFHALTPTIRGGDGASAPAPWSLPSATHPVLLDYVALRYQLFPYIRSVARIAGTDAFPAMSPLADEFPADVAAVHARDQFMLGPSLLVNPVVAPGTAVRALYLPAGCDWFDFWTGAAYAGGQHLQMPAPTAIMPLFVKSGSILPCAISPSHATTPSDAIELRVYPGRDARLDLDGPAGSLAVTWHEATRTVGLDAAPTTSARPTSAASRAPRVFHLVRVRPRHGVGLAQATIPDQRATYLGDALQLRLLAPPAPPSAPRGLLARTNRGRIELAWQAVPGASVYRLKRATRSGGPYRDVASSLTEPGHVDTAISAGLTYYYVVTAIHAGGESAPSAEAGTLIRSLFRTDRPRPDQLSPLSRSVHGGNRARPGFGRRIGPLSAPGLPILAAHHHSSP